MSGQYDNSDAAGATRAGDSGRVEYSEAGLRGQGDAEVFNEHRALLFSIAYRMLGSVADAEDMLQEAFIRWQQAARSEIENLRAFLVTIVSRLCINYLQSARVKREQYYGPWLPEPLVTAPASDPMAAVQIDESLSTAFLVLLERLNPVERAVFLLREAFDYDYDEIARIVDQREANCRQIFRRARLHLESEQPRLEASPQQQSQKLLQQFLQATSQGDMQGLIALLAEDVVLYTDGGGKATAVPNPIYGAEHVARFFLGVRETLMPRDVIRRFAEINGHPGVVVYHHDRIFGVLSLDFGEGRIRHLYIMRNPDKLLHVPSLEALSANPGGVIDWQRGDSSPATG